VAPFTLAQICGTLWLSYWVQAKAWCGVELDVAVGGWLVLEELVAVIVTVAVAPQAQSVRPVEMTARTALMRDETGRAGI
jgi:hypothetical protein